MSITPETPGNFLVLSFQYAYTSKYLINEVSANKDPRTLLRPAVYLLRHSIELLLKGLQYLRDNKTWGHDLTILNKNSTTIFYDIAPPPKFEKIAEEMKESPQEVYNIIINSWTEDLEDLSTKYTRHLYLEGFDSYDPKNMLLRYPDNQEFRKLFNDESKLDLRKLEKDSEEVFSISSTVIYILTNGSI